MCMAAATLCHYLAATQESYRQSRYTISAIFPFGLAFISNCRRGNFCSPTLFCILAPPQLHCTVCLHTESCIHSENPYDILQCFCYNIQVILRCRELEFFKQEDMWCLQDPLAFTCFRPLSQSQYSKKPKILFCCQFTVSAQ